MSSSYSSLYFHCVWCTRGRVPSFTQPLRDIVYPFIREEVAKEGGKVIEIGGTSDHVHILFVMKPAGNLSRFMRIIKSKGTWFMHQNSDVKGFSWKPGYGAFTVSVSKLDEVKKYIQNQEKFHEDLSSKEEYHALLKCHGILFENPYSVD